MQVGLALGQQRCTWDDLIGTAARADRLGFDSFWIFDHIVPLSPDLEDPVFECWTLMGALAQATSSVRLGQLVTANTLRAPALLAKMAATVDHVSNGRLIVGLGSGYWEPEHALYGIPFPSLKERGEMLEEACAVLKGLWRERRFSLDGKHYRLADAPAEPKPLQPGGPPLLLGGRGPERTLRTVARWADMWNMPPGSDGIVPDQWRALYEVLLARCEEIGRDPGEIETNVSLILVVDEQPGVAARRVAELGAMFGMSAEAARPHCVAGTPAEVAEQLREFEERGVQHFVLGLVSGFNVHTDDVELFAAEVEPLLG